MIFIFCRDPVNIYRIRLLIDHKHEADNIESYQILTLIETVFIKTDIVNYSVFFTT